MAGDCKDKVRIKRGMSHPLSGANPGTLVRTRLRGGGVKWRYAPELTAAMLSSLLKMPLSLIERAYVRLKQRTVEPVPDPIFIVGHWRSGTTHLYNVLSRSPQFGFVSPFSTALPWDFLVTGRLFRPILQRALPEGRYIDAVPVESDSPQEDEIALANMSPLSFYHALYFPRRFAETFEEGLWFEGKSEAQIKKWQTLLRYFYLKLQIEQPGTTPLIKNPVYTARIGMLAEIFPGARFIHIHRNPYKVFFSMRNFYDKLFRQFAFQSWDHIDIDAHIFSTYERMMAAAERDLAALPPGRAVEVRFDEFQDSPISELYTIFDAIGLPRFYQALPLFEKYLGTVQDYTKNVYQYPSDTTEEIGRRWQHQIARWEYQPPQADVTDAEAQE